MDIDKLRIRERYEIGRSIFELDVKIHFELIVWDELIVMREILSLSKSEYIYALGVGSYPSFGR
jgi:hypothetical protein